MSKDIIVKLNIDDNDYRNSLGYFESALEKIKNDPDHEFPQEEVDRLLMIEQEMQEAWKPFENGLAKMQETFNKLNEMFTKNMDGVSKFFKTLKDLTKKGWFVSDIILSKYRLDEIQHLLSMEDIEIGEFLMKKHGSNKEIKNKLRLINFQFPNRKTILNEIGRAYELKMYSSVVSLCYAQADGICSETWLHGFFDKDRKDDYKLKLFKKLENLDLGVSSYLVNHSGLSYNEITMHSGNDALKFQEVKDKSFNRHLVIHGHSLNYGTKVNAFRAILLLDFLVFCVKEWDKDK